ncbi:MAG: tol-pal system YbgF family protein [Elusimicrobiota bacterium]
MIQSRRLVVLAALAALLAGCDTYHFVAGTWAEDARKPTVALKHYEKFLADRPRDPRSCEVQLRAAEIYRGFGRCGEARMHWEAAVRDFPRSGACAERAKVSLLSCPDYFPLDLGRTWVYVDSESRGAAMRLEWEVRRSSGSSSGSIQTVLFAGNRRNREGVESYEKRDWAVWRTDAKPPEPFLRYPFGPDQSWSDKRGKALVDWAVVSTTETVKVAAGEFKDCLKVRELDRRYPKTWRYDYYCPDVGRAKTTIGGRGYENPNTELLRYGKM